MGRSSRWRCRRILDWRGRALLERGEKEMKYTFHLVPNAHLDPVWLWDWREGLNEGLISCRTILDLMDEDRDLTFIRGESAIYEHIERTDPGTFLRVARHVVAGGWGPVGGADIQ